jgi:hypothetical protein
MKCHFDEYPVTVRSKRGLNFEGPFLQNTKNCALAGKILRAAVCLYICR